MRINKSTAKRLMMSPRLCPASRFRERALASGGKGIMTKLAMFLIALIASLSIGAAKTVRCPVTADNWVSVPENRQAEGVDNHGTDTQLQVRGHDSFALFQFDVSGLKGRKIDKAVLRIHRENADPVPLHTVGVSTISGTAAWAEGARNKGPAAPGESNYFFARVGQQPWSY